MSAAALLVALGCASLIGNRRRGPGERPAATTDGQDFAENCRNGKLDCVHDLRIKLRHKDGTPFQFDQEWAPPLLQPDSLTLYPGYTVYVEAEPSGDALVLKRTVPRPVNPESTLTFSFEQRDDGSMQLTTHNPFPRHLKMRLGVEPLEDESERLLPASSCPVLARGSASEYWPDPIFLLVVVRSDLRLVEEGREGVTCN
jgi:hypothetical protein